MAALHLARETRSARLGARPRPRPHRATGAAPRGTSRKGGPPTVTPVADADRTLFDALRAWRPEAAREQAVPPYVVLHDATLVAIAARRPLSKAALAAVPGMGAVKLERYGADVLRVVEEAG